MCTRGVGLCTHGVDHDARLAREPQPGDGPSRPRRRDRRHPARAAVRAPAPRPGRAEPGRAVSPPRLGHGDEPGLRRSPRPPMGRRLARAAPVIVLDTAAWIWWVGDPAQLSPRARQAITAQEQDGLIVSAISVWEVAVKVALRRLTLDRD